MNNVKKKACLVRSAGKRSERTPTKYQRSLSEISFFAGSNGSEYGGGSVRAEMNLCHRVAISSHVTISPEFDCIKRSKNSPSGRSFSDTNSSTSARRRSLRTMDGSIFNNSIVKVTSQNHNDDCKKQSWPDFRRLLVGNCSKEISRKRFIRVNVRKQRIREF